MTTETKTETQGTVSYPTYTVPDHILNRFPVAPRSIWKDAAEKDWNNWIWQQQKRVKNLEDLRKVIKVTDEEAKAYEGSVEMFNMSITPYYASLMDPDDPNCPIRLQAVPKLGELHVAPEDMEDPLAEERDMPVPGLTHRYPDRVLFYTTHNCAMYCRFCTRKRKVSDPGSAAQMKQLDGALEYIRNHPEVRDVVVSGGDPLSNSDERLDYILGSLRAIPHVEMFRLGTRNLVTLPQRITDDFIYMLRKHHPVYVNTHFNHPKECTREAYDACRRLADAGVPISNQAVLLKGVNDSVETFKELNHKLLMMRVRPYYIYQCDLSQGIGHFRTPIEKGFEIIEGLRGHTSGLAVPHMVIDAPGGGGKIPILPQYFLGKEGRKVTLRNFRNQKFTYTEPE
ncbi:MAG: lysine 2,3-aminomutase [Bdellovibrionota bacterium]